MLPVATAADIGCDHGRLSIGLLQRGLATRVIATELSAPSLEKARRLAQITNRADQMDFRVGSGLSVLAQGEAEELAICGMGGALIADILAAAAQPLAGAVHCVLQPMRGVEALRRYLFSAGYRIEAERIALDQGRYYQVMRAVSGRDAFPPGWPEGCFLLGPKSLADPLLPALLRHMLLQCEKSLMQAKGSRGEAALADQRGQLQSIQKLMN